VKDESTKEGANELEFVLDVELSERELLSIGQIVALWGTLEFEIFSQTLLYFGGLSDSQLPKELNNMQFSKVLDLGRPMS
jgi:hypothetical protein